MRSAGVAFLAFVIAPALAGNCPATDAAVCKSECNGKCNNYDCDGMITAYGCDYIVNKMGCKECECNCKGFDPNAPTPTGECTGKSAPCFASLLDAQKAKILEAHNKYREYHGACPLTWDDEIAKWAKESSGFQTTCSSGSLTHNDQRRMSDGTSLGENLYMSSGKDVHSFPMEKSVKAWYCGEEGCWTYGGNSFNYQAGHFTQVIWKESTRLGCAACLGSRGVYVICNYAKAGNMQGAFVKNIGDKGSSPSGCTAGPAPPPTVNECDAGPCGSDQTCEDPSTTTSNDFVCTCKTDKAISSKGAKATCTLDECSTNPCGQDQTCDDPNTSYLSQHDFTCTCKQDTSIVRKDGPARCVKDECEAKPCGAEQTCTDTKQGVKELNDYTCQCKNNPDIKAVGTQATCEMNECNKDPCGQDQECNDPDPSPLVLHDFTCTCKNDTATKKEDGPALCVIDECSVNPCGPSQTCSDPDTRASSSADFVCTCPGGNTTEVGKPAVCSQGAVNECDQAPCPGQMCIDPHPEAGSTGDYICTCTSGMGQAKGKPAECMVDECEGSPCGNGQGCVDRNTSDVSLGDFECSCESPYRGTAAMGKEANCTLDECLMQLCGANQTCTDPSPARKDYVCRCANGVEAIGGPASCELNECDKQPCGAEQTCEDPNPSPASQHDFVCQCKADPNQMKVDGPAVCVKDECEANLCGDGQTCEDPVKTHDSLKDFVCTCKGTNISARGGAAKCGKDECLGSPCGAGQRCEDTDRFTDNDFVCTCDGLSIQAVGKRAECDECLTRPCRWIGHEDVKETCKDPSFDKRGDFTCTCPNGVSKVGGAAECETTGECSATPCGNDQYCTDPDPNVKNDFTCSCPPPFTGSAVGKKAECSLDECNPPQAPPPCPGQTCNDPNPSTKGDFICTCPNGLNESRGGPATCNDIGTPSPTTILPNVTGTPSPTTILPNVTTSPNTTLPPTPPPMKTPSPTTGPGTGVDECKRGSPCPTGQACYDHDKMSFNTFTCYCPSGSVCDECATNPCGAGQTCTDKNKAIVGNFMCSCPQGGAVSVGHAADCSRPTEINECLPNNPCGANQTCEDTKGSRKGDFKCSCSLPLKGAPAIGKPASCTPAVQPARGFKWRFLAFKFRARWSNIKNMVSWVLRLRLTLSFPYRNLQRGRPRVRVTLVCPLVNGLKPRAGTDAAKLCWSPVNAIQWQERAMRTMAGSQDELDMIDSEDGVFTEMSLEDDTEENVEEDKTIFVESMKKASEEQGVLGSTENWETGGEVDGTPVGSGLVIRPLPLGKTNTDTLSAYVADSTAHYNQEVDAETAWKSAAQLQQAGMVEEEEHSDDGDGLQWWVWLLVAIGGVLVLAGAAFTIRKTQTSDQVNFRDFVRMSHTDDDAYTQLPGDAPPKELDTVVV